MALEDRQTYCMLRQVWDLGSSSPELTDCDYALRKIHPFSFSSYSHLLSTLLLRPSLCIALFPVLTQCFRSLCALLKYCPFAHTLGWQWRGSLWKRKMMSCCQLWSVPRDRCDLRLSQYACPVHLSQGLSLFLLFHLCP